MKQLEFTVLVENAAPEGLEGEWGLSLMIRHDGGTWLLDTGASPLFAKNARKLGADLKQVDAAVLSHAHYDHSDGFDAFCDMNERAPIYIRRSVRENCYSRHGEKPKYIGVRKGFLKRRRDRIVRVEGKTEIAPGVWLLPHDRSGMKARGLKAQMFVRRGLWLRPDDFSHEQSLVFELGSGLVIFNSCCHGGVDAILEETSSAFPGKRILAVAGGFHLFRSTDEDVIALAENLKKLGKPMLYTGHCTGDRAMEILEERLPGCVRRLETGMMCTVEEESL